MRHTRIISLVAIAIAVFSACGTQPTNQETSNNEGNKSDLRLPVLGEEQIIKEVPANYPTDIPFLEGASEDNLYHDTDTSNGDMVFYTTSLTVEDAYNYYVTALANAGWTVTLHKQHNKDNAFIDFQKGEELCNIYFSGIIPTLYPKSLGLTGTFVAIRYNMKPLPDILAE